MLLRLMWSFKLTAQTFWQIFVVDVFETVLFIVWNFEIISILVLSFTLDGETVIKLDSVLVCHQETTENKQ